MTKLRFSATDTSVGLQEENSYYTGDEDNILTMYAEWRNEYAKGDFDNTRYQNFRANYIKLMTSNAVELTVARDMGCSDPVPLSLNEYGDFSPDEFNNLQNDPPSDLSYPESSNEYVYPQTAGYKAYDGANDQDRIRQIYEEWCFRNEKLYDESRLQTFATNLRVVENYYRETGKKAELNQYANLSPEEYQAIAASVGEEAITQSQQNPHLEYISTHRQTPLSTLHQYFDETEVERIQHVYLEWCGFNGKEYIESRLDTFATNLLALESYCAETGQNDILNVHADLTLEEYNSMVSSDTEAPPNDMNSYSSNTGTSDDAIYDQDESVIHSSTNNKGSSYLESLSVVSSTIVDQGIRAVYQDWCEYYEKPPSEDGLYYFTKNYIFLEKHHRETGEELTLNEIADLPAEEFRQEPESLGSEEGKSRLEREIIHAEEPRRSGEARLQEEAEEERRKVENDHEWIGQARRNEEKRKKSEELLRLEKERKLTEEEVRRQKEEERAKFEEAKKARRRCSALGTETGLCGCTSSLRKEKGRCCERGSPREC